MPKRETRTVSKGLSGTAEACVEATHSRKRKRLETAQRILEEKGGQSLREAQRLITGINTESQQVREALTYFTSYWQDLARPTLVVLACESVGGSPEAATPFGTASVLISGAIAIHDDVIDHSRMKRSRLTVLGKYGENIALITANALLFEGFTHLYRLVEKGLQPGKMADILKLLKQLFTELGDAEALELGFRKRVDVTPENYLNMVWRKAGDVEAQMRVGALLGNASTREVEALAKYGRSLGMMMILRDDLADMLEAEEMCHRVRWESLPLPVLYALSDSKAREEAESIIGRKKIGVREALRLLEISDEARGLAQFGDTVRRLAEEAVESIKHLRNKEALVVLVETVIPSV